MRTQARWACVVCAFIRLLPHTSLPAHQWKEALAKVRRSQRPRVTFGPRKGVVCRPQTAPPTPPHAPTNCDVRKTRSGARRTHPHTHTQQRGKQVEGRVAKCGWRGKGGRRREGGAREENCMKNNRKWCIRWMVTFTLGVCATSVWRMRRGRREGCRGGRRGLWVADVRSRSVYCRFPSWPPPFLSGGNDWKYAPTSVVHNVE